MKTKIWIFGICAVILVAVVVLFAAFANRKMKSSGDEIGITAEEIEVPDTVRDAAMQLVEQKYTDMQDNGYSNWRIETLEYVYTYDDFDGMILQIYQMNYEFLADEPETVTLAGGMTIDEDGWVTPEYANSTYLVFGQKGEELSYLTYLVENDCFPGDEVFTDDLKQLLDSPLSGSETFK